MIGPVVAFLVVQFPGTYAIEIEIPSPNRPELTSYVLICREKNRFVDELQIPNPGHNLASSEFLTEQSIAEEDEPQFTEMKQSGTEETRAGTSQESSRSSVLQEKHHSCEGEEVEQYSCLSIVQRNNALNKFCDDIDAQF